MELTLEELAALEPTNRDRLLDALDLTQRSALELQLAERERELQAQQAKVCFQSILRSTLNDELSDREAAPVVSGGLL